MPARTADEPVAAKDSYKGSMSSLPGPVWNVVKRRVPTLAREFLGSAEPLSSLEAAITFMSVYPVLLESAGMVPPKPSHEFVARSRAVHQNAESRVLADWFRGRFLARSGTLLAEKLGSLKARRLTDQHIADVFLYCAMTPYGCRAQGQHCETPTNASTAKDTGDAEQDDRGAPDWLHADVMRLACDWRFCASQACLVLKHLIPEQLELVLDVLDRTMAFSPGSRACRALLRVSPELLRKWLGTARQQFRRCRWFIGEDDAGHAVETAPHIADVRRLTIYDRIHRIAEGLDLCFIVKSRPMWYRVDVANGRILRLGETTAETDRYHLALKRVGNACTRLHRGGHEILLAFVKNACVTGADSPDAANRRNYRGFLLELLDGHSELLLAKCAPGALRLARSMTRRNAIAWEIYRLIQQHGLSSDEVSRIQSFARDFPSLFRIIPRGFLWNVVAPGTSLRQVIPYWSKAFQQAAREPARNYEEARDHMMRATLLSMGARPEWIEGHAVVPYLREWRFFLPFVRQHRYREAFFLFVCRTLARKRRPVEEFCPLFRYVRATGHLCNRYTTFRSLKRRSDAWLRSEAQRRAVEAIGDNRPFPEPWFGQAWVEESHRMVYLMDPEALWYHSRDQMNCSFSYGSDIRFGAVQLYRLEDCSGQGLATVEVVDDGEGNLVLGEKLGPANTPLPAREKRAIQRWFAHTGAAGRREGGATDCFVQHERLACLMES